MPQKKRQKTKYPGVYFIEGRGASGPEKIYYVQYRKDGRMIEEKAGRQFRDNMTPSRAAGIRARRIEGKELSNKEHRDAQKAQKDAAEGRMTISKLWSKYKASGKGEKSRNQDESTYKRFADVLGEKEPRELVPLDIERLKRKTLAGKSPQTQKLTLALLRRLVRYGVQVHRIQGLTFTLEMPKVNNEVIETLTDAQMKKLLKALHESDDIQASGLMMLALATGMRKGELLKLQWRDVNSESNFIRIRDPKGKKDTSIPMNATARSILDNHPKLGAYVFVNSQKEPFKDIRKRIDKIRKAAKLPDDFRPIHGLRHVYATTLANSGEVDIYTLQRLLTHKDVKTTARYAHLMDQRLQSATGVMDRLIKGA